MAYRFFRNWEKCFIKNIVGFMKSDTGSTKIDEIDITRCSASRRGGDIGYVFQESALFDSLNIFDNAAFGVKALTSFGESEIKQRVTQLAYNVGIGKYWTFKIA
jgi:phospholipid/cholesterol/gamma-HCH transport system ATP-binding protein